MKILSSYVKISKVLQVSNTDKNNMFKRILLLLIKIM